MESLSRFGIALFFGAILCLMRRRYRAVLGFMFLESLSHPFTGIQLLLIVLTFSVLERVVNASTAPPVWFASTTAVLAAAHLGYYVFLLKALSPEHRDSRG